MQQTSYHAGMSAVIRKCCSRAAGGLISSRSYAKFRTLPFNFLLYAPRTHGITRCRQKIIIIFILIFNAFIINIIIIIHDRIF
ncbi:unnamed protein product [Onchocerca flexuosa]|uniref:Uncharacterized protein n=1 Tax=Onchocerca flexuosa TaxID=387005 RepID=A0A183H0X8_9BILA|nr:unnamed protein product [Onchocerca flexuosa]